jgi:predicted PurR-regulated permease PerM
MRREHLFAAFFFAVFAFLLYQFYRILYFFVGPLSWATLLALVSYPLHEHLTRWLRKRDGLAAFLLTTAVILIVIVPTIYLSALVSTQSVELYHTVNDFVRSGRLTETVEQIRASRAGRLWQGAMPTLQHWNVDLPALALKTSNAISSFLVAQAPAAAANVLRFVTNFFLTTFALFFCFRDGAKMVRGLRELIPMEPQHKDAILKRIYDTLSAVMQGTLVTAFVQGVLAGIGFWVVGVPFATLLGGATGFFSLLPFAGPLIWLSVVIYLVFGAAYGKAVLLLVWGTLIVSSADNFLRPLIIGNRTKIPTVFLFFGILGGLQAYGFLGIFLGPALIAILVAFVRIYQEQYATGSETIVPLTPDE